MAASVSIQKAIYIGTFVHNISLSELEICEKGAIGVDSNGVIKFIERDVTLEQAQEKHESWSDAKVVMIAEDGFLFPGFVGTYFSICYQLKMEGRYFFGFLFLRPTTVLNK